MGGSDAMKLAFIGFGEAGRAFCKSLKGADPTLEFAAYDLLLDGEGEEGPTARAMRELGVTVAATLAAGLEGADWVVSAVTADQCQHAAMAAAPLLAGKEVFLDINSVSPQRKRDNAERIEATGAVYIDMAVMAPVAGKGHRTPVLVAGPAIGEIAGRLTELGFDYRIAGEVAGAATAIKMVRSVFVKGLEALTVETLLAAEASNCLPEIQESLAGSYPGLGWPDFAAYQFERTSRHGKRRAAEMHESAATLNDLGLFGGLASAVADVQQRMAEAQRHGVAATRGAFLLPPAPEIVAETTANPCTGRGFVAA
jgi:3-hydroxyisobutyrate dehydrogenase-like beta-hydroxyacid dehydrogenase